MKTKQIDEATLAILSKVTITGNQIFLTCGQLTRKEYVEVDNVLKNMGGTWNRKAKAHVFADDPTDKLEAVLLTGEIIKPQDYGCFYTPPDRAKRVIELAEIKPGMSVLEPSAGQAGIADFVPVTCNLTCVEILEENRKILLNRTFSCKWLSYKVIHADFLKLEPNPASLSPIYDRVVMNPCFSAPGDPQADISHVLHAWKFLKPGGRLVSIMSAGVIFRKNKKTVAFREMLDQYGHYERNPEGSFKVSGTGVNTVIVIMDKPL